MIDMTDEVMCRFCMGRGYNLAPMDSRDWGVEVKNECIHCEMTGLAIVCDFCGHQMRNTRRWVAGRIVDMHTWRCKNPNCAE